jgi:hypothetical protein
MADGCGERRSELPLVQPPQKCAVVVTTRFTTISMMTQSKTTGRTRPTTLLSQARSSADRASARIGVRQHSRSRSSQSLRPQLHRRNINRNTLGA